MIEVFNLVASRMIADPILTFLFLLQTRPRFHYIAYFK